jgi:hypothetical protein
MVRKGGFEPPRDCSRQPLKLVRLPFRHFRVRDHGPPKGGHYARLARYFGGVVGVGAGVAGRGAGVASAPFGTGGGPGVPLRSDPGPR